MLPQSCLLAAVDLGSNSFRLEIDHYQSSKVMRQDYLREPVRLGRGLGADFVLDQDAMKRGWKCLEKFGQHIQKHKVHSLRAIATQTLRQAINKDEFIQKGQELLGAPIEIVTGEQEALLIYTGVCAVLDTVKIRRNLVSTEKRLVTDIGGRSTEIIIGQGLKARGAISCPIGSVGMSMDFFSDGLLTKDHFEKAIDYASAHFNTAAKHLKSSVGHQFVWDQAYGSSGTIGSISNVLRKNGITSGCITRPALNWIHKRLLHAGAIDKIQLAGLGARQDVVGGGLAILLAFFSTFKKLRSITPARGALRQGIIYEMIIPPETR